MASALEEREEQSSKCFICNMKVTTRSSYNVYCTFMPQREKLLIDVMSKILKKILNPSQMRSSVLCRRCFTLFDELDHISIRFKKLQTDIIKRYTSTCIEYKDETFVNIVNSMTSTKIIELPLSVKENENKSMTIEDESEDKSPEAFNEIVETIINNIQAEETMDNDEVNLKKSITDNLPNNNLPIDQEITKRVNDTVTPLPSGLVEKPSSETKIKKRDGVSYKCVQCKTSFRRASDLKSHCATVHQSPKKFFCSICDKSYSSKQSLNSHLIKEHKIVEKQINDQIDDSTCSIKIENDVSECGLDTNLEVSQEYTNNSSENVVIDVKPEYSIDNNMFMEEIVPEGKEDDDFEWKEDKKFNNYNEENIVEDSSSAIDETITTPSSGSEKSVKRQIKKERKKRGSSRSGERACLPAIHSCEMCGKKWRTVTELKSHIQSHSTLRPYVCEICGQAYKMKKALDVHIGMHNGIHPFTCEFCNKSFTQKVGLQKHIPIHTGYTRFQCDLCGKRFIHQKSFHIHTMTHTGEKHVKCPECGLAVLSQSHLKRHLRVHTGERPYACPICGKRFAEKYNMNAHVHIHENNSGTGPRRNRNHICQLCGMSYDRKHKLEYHLASTHNKIESKFSQDQETEQLKNEFFQENSQNHQIITVDNSSIEHCDMSFDRKLKLEYHLTPPHNKIDGKLSQDQETEQQSQNEFFHENTQGHQIITVENSTNGSTAMITVSGVKVPITLDGDPIMVTSLPQQSQTTNLVPVPLNLPAGSILAYTPTNSNSNDQPIVDGSQNAYMSQNPVTIQLS